MNQKKEPKNKNITVRVTSNHYNELNNIAYMLGMSVSKWANIILINQKDNYKKRVDIVKLIRDVDLENLKMELIQRLLKKLQIENKNTFGEPTIPEINQIKLAIKILDMTTFKSDYAIDELIREYHSPVHHSQL